MTEETECYLEYNDGRCKLDDKPCDHPPLEERDACYQRRLAAIEAQKPESVAEKSPTEHARLFVSFSNQSNQGIEITNRLKIGRSPKNELCLDDSQTSRYHAEIRRNNKGQYLLTDNASANGTWLNGNRITVPEVLTNGDSIKIGETLLHFIHPQSTTETERDDSESDFMPPTQITLRDKFFVIMVSDIRNYSSMSEALPGKEFSQLVSDWFRDCSEIINANKGTVDKYLGDAVMAYWPIKNSLMLSEEINLALESSCRMIELSKDFSERLASQFGEYEFQVGVGLNCGEAVWGNVGTAQNPSFTIVGDNVNLAFCLESLTKKEDALVIVSDKIAECASERFQFRDLGHIQVKGRQQQSSIKALIL